VARVFDPYPHRLKTGATVVQALRCTGWNKMLRRAAAIRGSNEGTDGGDLSRFRPKTRSVAAIGFAGQPTGACARTSTCAFARTVDRSFSGSAGSERVGAYDRSGVGVDRGRAESVHERRKEEALEACEVWQVDRCSDRRGSGSVRLGVDDLIRSVLGFDCFSSGAGFEPGVCIRIRIRVRGALTSSASRRTRETPRGGRWFRQ